MKFLESYTKTEEKDRGIPGVKMHAPIVQGNPLNDIGIELEIEGNNLPTDGHLAAIRSPVSRATWAVHRDGSLRGEALEYVLSTPVKPSELEYMLAALWEKFKTSKTAMTLSNRCSTHVHVNVGGAKINEITSVIALWTTLEEVLINWCGLDRVSNHFCLPSSQSSTVIRTWGRFLENGQYDFPEGMKYSALNLRPMRTFGSVEFRTMRASEDYVPILDWALFCHGLVGYARDKYSVPALMANELSERSGHDIFMAICDKAGVSQMFRDSVLSHEMNDDFNGKCMNGFRRAQPLIGMFPWEKWSPVMNKEYIQNPFVDESRGFRSRTRAALNPEHGQEDFGEDAQPAPRPALIPGDWFQQAPQPLQGGDLIHVGGARDIPVQAENERIGPLAGAMARLAERGRVPVPQPVDPQWIRNAAQMQNFAAVGLDPWPNPRPLN